MVLLSGRILALVALIFVFTVFLIPFALVLYPLAFVVPFLANGYYLRVVERTIDGDPDPPAFGPTGAIVADAIRFLAVALVYSLPALVVIVGGHATALGLAVSASQPADPSSTVGLVPVLVLVGSMIVAVVPGAVAAYLLPVALCSMSQDGRFRAAFDLGRIRTVAASGEYLVGWSVAVAVWLVVGGLVFVSRLLLVGYLLGPFLTFPARMVSFRLFAVGYREALGIEVGAADDTAGHSPDGTTPRASR